MSPADPRPIVTLVYQAECPACREAKPEFALACRDLAAQVRGRLADIDKTKASFPVLYTPTIQLQLPHAYYLTDPTKTPMNRLGLRVWITLCLQDAARKAARSKP